MDSIIVDLLFGELSEKESLMRYVEHRIDVSRKEASLVRSDEVGVFEGSHRKGAENNVGSIGEIVFKVCMGQYVISVLFTQDISPKRGSQNQIRPIMLGLYRRDL